MSCNCVKEVQEELKNMLPKKNEEWSKRNIESVEFDNVCWMLDGTGTRVYSVVNIVYEQANKKGEVKSKKAKVNMNFTHCPFCGKKYDESKEVEE